MLLTITIFELSSKSTYMEKDPPNNAIYALLLSKAYRLGNWEGLGDIGALGGILRHLTGLEGYCVNLRNSGELGRTWRN